jgi:hypothetical protein
MQNLFAEDTPSHTPWMERVLPVVAAIARHQPDRMAMHTAPGSAISIDGGI